MLFKKYGLLYADEMVLLAENMQELQDLLDKLHVCCPRGSLTKINQFLTKLKKNCGPGKESTVWLPIDCQLKRFNNTFVPILTYGFEIWGYGYLSIIQYL